MGNPDNDQLKLWQGWRDVFFIVDWYAVGPVVGVVALATVEYDWLKKPWPDVQEWIETHTFWVVLAGIALTTIPPAYAHIRSVLERRRDLVETKRGEARMFLKFQTDYVQKRTKYLIPKAREVARGKVTDEYIKNVLVDCEAYFKARKEGATVRAYYYALSGRSGNRKLEYKLGHRDPGAARSTFSESKNSTEEAKMAVARISDGNHVYCKDVSDASCIESLRLDVKRRRQYRSFLSVPVFRDGDHDVMGMLSVNCDEVGILKEVDHATVRTFAWFFATSQAIDSTRDTQVVAKADEAK